MTQVNIRVPEELPFLEALQWSGDPKQVYRWDRLTMLRRYEQGWDWKGLLGEPSQQERLFIGELAKHYGSYLREEALR